MLKSTKKHRAIQIIRKERCYLCQIEGLVEVSIKRDSRGHEINIILTSSYPVYRQGVLPWELIYDLTFKLQNIVRKQILILL
jgi:hypothetical protein